MGAFMVVVLMFSAVNDGCKCVLGTHAQPVRAAEKRLSGEKAHTRLWETFCSMAGIGGEMF